MPNQLNIRSLYRPVQPAVKQPDRKVEYREYAPDDRISHMIYCYWELKTTEKLEEKFVYRVVADGCIDIFFRLDNPEENYIMGFCKTFTEHQLGHEFHYAGIRFLPTMFPALFHLDTKEINGRFERLDLVLKNTSAFISGRLSSKPVFPDIKAKLDRYFLTLLTKRDITIDSRFQNAMYLLLKNFRSVHIQKDLATGLSPRQLRRYFEFYVGDSAKTFSQVIRFQKVLHAQSIVHSKVEQNLFFDYGYYDQAHFIKEFRKFYGLTPAKVFKP